MGLGGTDERISVYMLYSQHWSICTGARGFVSISGPVARWSCALPSSALLRSARASRAGRTTRILSWHPWMRDLFNCKSARAH